MTAKEGKAACERIMRVPESLTYCRVAYEKKDGANGFVYLHHFGTGWQELIFPSHEAANKRRESLNK